MAENKVVEQKKGYFVGEISQQVEGGRMMVQVVAKPNGEAMTDKEWQVEVLNKLDNLYSLMKQSL